MTEMNILLSRARTHVDAKDAVKLGVKRSLRELIRENKTTPQEEQPRKLLRL
jgi:hypothetical protein